MSDQPPPFLSKRTSSFARMLNRTGSSTIGDWLSSAVPELKLRRTSSLLSSLVREEVDTKWNEEQSFMHVPLGNDKDSDEQSSARPAPLTTGTTDDYGFNIVVEDSGHSTPRASTWVYSALLHQVFATMDTTIPLTFICNKAVPTGSYLLLHLQYLKGEHKGVVVTRCATHHSSDTSPNRDHVLRSENDAARYFTQDSRFSLSLPVLRNATGLIEQTELFRMMCFTSCAGGINRRPTQIVARLVGPDSTILATAHVKIRVCACPTRDRRNHERSNAATTLAGMENGGPQAKKAKRKKDAKVKLEPNVPQLQPSVTTICRLGADYKCSNGEHSVVVCGQANFELLSRLRATMAAVVPSIAMPSTHATQTPASIATFAALKSVPEFLQAIGMSKYTEMFLKQGYDDLDLMECLNKEDLDQLPIISTLDAQKLLVSSNMLAQVPRPNRHHWLAREADSQLLRVTLHRRQPNTQVKALQGASAT